MAPHSLDTILRPPQWPAALSDFVTWCLMWDPKSRPTSAQALSHDFFKDAVDPLIRPKSSSKLLGRKQSNLSHTDSMKDITEPPLPTLTAKTSNWFRKSLVSKDVTVQVATPQSTPLPPVPVQPVVQPVVQPTVQPILPPSNNSTPSKARPSQNKRNTWTNGLSSNAAPIPILPTIRPISPLSDAVTAQAHVGAADADANAKKVGRQLSVNSNTHPYADVYRHDAERSLNAQGGLSSPLSGHRESFFSHLRKRARRFSGRYQIPMSPGADDIEANAGGFASNRHSMVIDSPHIANHIPSNDLSDLDRALQNVKASLDDGDVISGTDQSNRLTTNSVLKRHLSIPKHDEQHEQATSGMGMFRSRSNRKKHPQAPLHYDTPDEEDELLNEAIASARKVANRLDKNVVTHHPSGSGYLGVASQAPRLPGVTPQKFSYLTPNPSGNRSDARFGHTDYTSSKPVDILKPKGSFNDLTSKWPTPPSDSEWATAAAASIFAAGAAYR